MSFDEKETPKFNENARHMKIENTEFTIYYSPECPYVEYEVKELSEYAKEHCIPIHFIKIDTLEKAKMPLAYLIIGRTFIKESLYLIQY